MAWAVTVAVCASHAPWAVVRALVPMLAFGGWFLHLLDVQMGGVKDHRRIPFTSGWPLLGAATASAITATEQPLIVFIAAEFTLFALAAWVWIDVRRA